MDEPTTLINPRSCTRSALIDVLNKVQYRHIASVSVSVSVSFTAVTVKSGFGRSLDISYKFSFDIRYSRWHQAHRKVLQLLNIYVHKIITNNDNDDADENFSV